MIVNIRGTGGSGKSTLVKRIMSLYPRQNGLYTEGRKRPYGMLLEREGRPLFVPGHYDTACGGCDTIRTTDQVYDLLHGYKDTHDIIYEGIMVSEDVVRAVKLSQNCEGFLAIGLTTPIEECISAIEARRLARGKMQEHNAKKTIARYEACKRGLARLRDADVRVEKLDRETAYLRCKEILKI